jgi:hypothetical protein
MCLLILELYCILSLWHILSHALLLWIQTTADEVISFHVTHHLIKHEDILKLIKHYQA